MYPKSGRNINVKKFVRHASPGHFRRSRSPSPVKSPRSYLPKETLVTMTSEVFVPNEEFLCREYNLTSRDYWIYKSIFDVIDYKRNNQVEPMEMRMLLHHLDIDVTNDKTFLYSLFADLDTQGKGYFTFQDFLGLMARGNNIGSIEGNCYR